MKVIQRVLWKIMSARFHEVLDGRDWHHGRSNGWKFWGPSAAITTVLALGPVGVGCVMRAMPKLAFRSSSYLLK